jgi:hypothetical protein
MRRRRFPTGAAVAPLAADAEIVSNISSSLLRPLAASEIG